LVVPAASLLAAPRGEALLTRAATAWRSFPHRLPLTAAALLLLANVVFLGTLTVRRRTMSTAGLD
jgi:hypothetical protein